MLFPKIVSHARTAQQRCFSMKHDSALKPSFAYNVVMNPEYNISDLWTSNVKCHDVEEMTHKVAIERFEGKNIGLVATEDIMPGQWVLVSKAYEIAFGNEMSAGFNNAALFDSVLHETLVSKIINRMESDPSTRTRIYDLFDGNEAKSLEKGKMASLENGPIDKSRIDSICFLNSFQDPDAASFHAWNENASIGIHPPTDCGLWILPSYINHSCSEANTIWFRLGNIMFFRPVKKIDKGDEILTSYLDPSLPYLPRHTVIQDKHKFDCSCPLCQVDKMESYSVHQKRRELLAKFSNVFSITRSAKLVEILKQLVYLRQGDLRLNPCVVHPMAQLLRIVSSSWGRCEGVDEVFNLAERVHASFRTTSLARMVPHLSMGLADCYEVYGDKEKRNLWLEKHREDLSDIYDSPFLYDDIVGNKSK